MINIRTTKSAIAEAISNSLRGKPIRKRISVYLPHQSKKECSRRIKQLEKKQ